MCDFMQSLGDAMRMAEGSSAISMDRNRPYDGQPHTDAGIRGMQEVYGVTMRDIQDCLIRAMVRCIDFTSESGKDLRRKLDEGTLIWDNIYEADFSNIDPLAMGKNLACEIEKLMGIFPNIPGTLSYKD